MGFRAGGAEHDVAGAWVGHGPRQDTQRYEAGHGQRRPWLSVRGLFGRTMRHVARKSK